MQSTGKARDCLGFSLLLVEQVARGFLTNKKVSTQEKANAGLVLVLIESALFSTVTNSANATTTPVRFFETTTQALFSSYMLGVK